MISTNNIHQNISIFTEERPQQQGAKKILLTEGSVKGVRCELTQTRSREKLMKKDSKKVFEKMRMRKDKKSIGNAELRLNKSKDWKEKSEAKERHIKTQAAEEEDELQIPEIEML